MCKIESIKESFHRVLGSMRTWLYARHAAERELVGKEIHQANSSEIVTVFSIYIFPPIFPLPHMACVFI